MFAAVPVKVALKDDDEDENIVEKVDELLRTCRHVQLVIQPKRGPPGLCLYLHVM